MTKLPKLCRAGRTWAADMERLASISISIDSTDPATKERPRYETLDGVAMIDIQGVMLKTYDAWLDVPPYITFTNEIQRAVRDAIADEEVGAILLNVNSPGGLADGCEQLYRTIAEAAKVKPVHAHIDGMAASAAFYAIAGASRITVEKSSFAGSIGTYMVVDDWSAFYAKAGVKAHVVTSAPPLKGAGVQGSEVTPEQLAMWQREVDALAKQFKAAVQAGRGLTDDQVAAVATGEVWIGPEAVALGLADDLGTIDSAFAEAAAHNNKGARMSAATNLKVGETKPVASADNTPTPATVNELQAAFPNATDSFYVSCLTAGMTIAQAKDAYIKRLETDKANSDKDAADSKALAEANAKAAAEAAAKIAAITSGTSAIPNVTAKAEEPAKSEWDNDAKLRAEFGNDKAAYEAYSRAAARGLVTTKGN